MGKRSRKRGDVVAARTPPRTEATPRASRRPAAPQGPAPAETFLGRAKQSWTLAGQRPAGELSREERKARARTRRETREAERPQGLFGPYPVSEVLMLVGIVGLFVTFAVGLEGNEPALIASIAVIAIGTFELTAREHFRGFKQHSFFLALIVAVAVHVTAAVAGPDGTGGRAELLLVDLVVFGTAFWQFSLSFSRARRRKALS